MPLGGDFTKYGGIYRPVSLLVTEKVCISPLDYASSGVYITPTTVSEKMAIVDIATKVSNEAIGNEKVKMVINAFDQQGVLITSSEKSEAVKAGKTHSFTQRIHIDSPHLWQGRVDPYLYRVEVGLFINGKLADKITQPLGLRYFHVDPEEGFFLNGKYLDLFGVNRHQDRAGKGSALSPADHKEDMDLIYEIGANMMRLSHYPHAQEVYDYADSTGLILWSEIPFVGQGGYRNKGYYPM
ncbi:MAG: beta-galactosidase, partial [Cyclobacteriaceae bacterium]|nr:beta-galactosidase [Cyclobacteriaceae bacterium HetDA_MAG_MS6]